MAQTIFPDPYGGAPVAVQIFDSTNGDTGTWTKPTGAKLVFVVCIGKGGAGGTGDTTQGTGVLRKGGAGGGAGGASEAMFLADRLGATEAIDMSLTNGFGHSGGSVFGGGKLWAGHGQVGQDGVNGGAAGRGGYGNFRRGCPGGAGGGSSGSNPQPISGVAVDNQGPGGGAGGGNVTSGNVEGSGGIGTNTEVSSQQTESLGAELIKGGTPGAPAEGNGPNASDGVTWRYGGGGGGGGGSNVGYGGTGGNGGKFAGGGGGSGASTTPLSGSPNTPGAGGAGMVAVITFF